MHRNADPQRPSLNGHKLNLLQSHILYIEDHEDTRDLMTLVLARSNYRVTAISSGKEALKLAGQEHFDLYILDTWLCDGSGVELSKRLSELNPETPIMFLSAAAYEKDKQAAIDNGAQRYLVKPIDLEIFSNEVKGLILAFAVRQEEASGPTPGCSPRRTVADLAR